MGKDNAAAALAGVELPDDVAELSPDEKSSLRWNWIHIAYYAAMGIISFFQSLPRQLVGLFILVAAFLIWHNGWLLACTRRNRRRFQYVSERYVERLLADDSFRQAESAKAIAAADKRHESNRKRNADARAVYVAGTWATVEAAKRDIAAQFHVVPKTVERWIAEWRNNE